VTHELQGTQSSPHKIERETLLSWVSSLEVVTPHAITSFDLIVDDEQSLKTSRINHIDLPEPIRDGRPFYAITWRAAPVKRAAF